jgi:hypothetical protein
MRINVYYEELRPAETPQIEIVTANYVSSRTGQPMTNYGLRIYLKSHSDLHYVPPRDDDRSAVTFWCGSDPKAIRSLLEDALQVWKAVEESKP